MRGRGAFAVGGPLTIDVSAERHGPDAAGATTPAAPCTITADVSGLTTPTGLLCLEAATVNASVDAEALSRNGLDIAAGMRGKLTEAFGPSITLAVKADGSLQDATASVVRHRGGDASASFRIAPLPAT